MGFPDEDFHPNAPSKQKNKTVEVSVSIETHKDVAIEVPEDTDAFELQFQPDLVKLIKSLTKDGWVIDDYYVEEK